MACRNIANWKNLILSVNISPTQLSVLNFVPEIKKIAAAHGLPLSRLEIEITERAVIRNARAAKRVVDELHEEGAKVSLDDFGIGYASLGYLRELSFDKMKLDKSLTQSFAESQSTRSIVEGTILIAKGLSVDIVAEGVETEDQARSMCLAGRSHLQGFYLRQPQSLQALEEMFPLRDSSVDGVDALS